MTPISCTFTTSMERLPRSLTSAGFAKASVPMLGAIRILPSTWKITPSLQPPGTILAPTNLTFRTPSISTSNRRRDSAALKPSREVKAQTKSGASCKVGTSHSSSTRVQPSQAQHVLFCSRSSRSLKIVSSLSSSSAVAAVALLSTAGSECLLEKLRLTELVFNIAAAAAWFPPARQFAAKRCGSPLRSWPGRDMASPIGISRSPALQSGCKKPSASMVAAFPTR
mmetsp:Transcript_91004/g.190320  ORF Transcript_91004/g.190320 Transcript_91004/m.190320 type:complete len:225 (+) Transcript_91004:925-1599(+)